MKTNIISSLRLTLVLLVMLSGLYPLVVAGIGKLAPGQGKGIKAEHKGIITGYENIGQAFYSAHYFHGRPSAVDYNAAASGGSNKAPSNPEYLAQVQARIDSFLIQNPGVKRNEIPVDLVTASGSGLDPHISPEAAKVQVKRVAKARNINEALLIHLVEEQTEQPLLGLFGPKRVNVLKLNLALDEKNPVQSHP